jgi:hypothetical protein
MDSGLVGQLVVREAPGNDLQQGLYDDDSLPALIVQDWWRDPVVSDEGSRPWNQTDDAQQTMLLLLCFAGGSMALYA